MKLVARWQFFEHEWVHKARMNHDSIQQCPAIKCIHVSRFVQDPVDQGWDQANDVLHLLTSVINAYALSSLSLNEMPRFLGSSVGTWFFRRFELAKIHPGVFSCQTLFKQVYAWPRGQLDFNFLLKFKIRLTLCVMWRATQLPFVEVFLSDADKQW